MGKSGLICTPEACSQIQRTVHLSKMSLLTKKCQAITGCRQHTTPARANVSVPCYRGPCSTWSRPEYDRDNDFIKPSYVPKPFTTPIYNPDKQPEGKPLYEPPPEFKPAELPDKEKELPSGPKMPERRPDPIPAGNPKEKPGQGEPEKREAPPSPPQEAPSPKK